MVNHHGLYNTQLKNSGGYDWHWWVFMWNTFDLRETLVGILHSRHRYCQTKFPTLWNKSAQHFECTTFEQDKFYVWNRCWDRHSDFPFILIFFTKSTKWKKKGRRWMGRWRRSKTPLTKYFHETNCHLIILSGSIRLSCIISYTMSYSQTLNIRETFDNLLSGHPFKVWFWLHRILPRSKSGRGVSLKLLVLLHNFWTTAINVQGQESRKNQHRECREPSKIISKLNITL